MHDTPALIMQALHCRVSLFCNTKFTRLFSDKVSIRMHLTNAIYAMLICSFISGWFKNLTFICVVTSAVCMHLDGRCVI